MQQDMDYNLKLISALNVTLHSNIRRLILLSTLGISIVAGVIAFIVGIKVKKAILQY